jgi:hypothetical protein
MPTAADSGVDRYRWFDMVTCMNCGGPNYNLSTCNGIEGVTYGTCYFLFRAVSRQLAGLMQSFCNGR